MESLISSYAAELVFLLAGSNIIAIAWEVTGVDKRIAAFVLSWVGTSVRQQIAVWFLAATILSSVLPNTVVAAIMCSIAISMLKFAGQGDLKNGSVGPIIMLAIVWGANNGGMLTPLGGSMNLITVSYIEELTNSEFIYTDWVVQLFPFGLVVTIITLLFLFSLRRGRRRYQAPDSISRTCMSQCRQSEGKRCFHSSPLFLRRLFLLLDSCISRSCRI